MKRLHTRLANEGQALFAMPDDVTEEEIKRVALEVYGFKTVSEFLRLGLRYLVKEQPILQYAPKKK